MNKALNEFKLKRAELWLKAVGLLLTLATIVFGLFQYFHQLSYENSMEFKRKFWENQIEVYSNACKYAGLIANYSNQEEFEKHVKSFNALYWGKMIMVDDSVVENAMKEFYLAIKDFNPQDKKSGNKLKYKADQLANACRTSSFDTWNKFNE